MRPCLPVETEHRELIPFVHFESRNVFGTQGRVAVAGTSSARMTSTSDSWSIEASAPDLVWRRGIEGPLLTRVAANGREKVLGQ